MNEFLSFRNVFVFVRTRLFFALERLREIRNHFEKLTHALVRGSGITLFRRFVNLFDDGHFSVERTHPLFVRKPYRAEKVVVSVGVDDNGINFEFVRSRGNESKLFVLPDVYGFPAGKVAPGFSARARKPRSVRHETQAVERVFYRFRAADRFRFRIFDFKISQIYVVEPDVIRYKINHILYLTELKLNRKRISVAKQRITFRNGFLEQIEVFCRAVENVS